MASLATSASGTTYVSRSTIDSILCAPTFEEALGNLVVEVGDSVYSSSMAESISLLGANQKWSKVVPATIPIPRDDEQMEEVKVEQQEKKKKRRKGPRLTAPPKSSGRNGYVDNWKAARDAKAAEAKAEREAVAKALQAKINAEIKAKVDAEAEVDAKLEADCIEWDYENSLVGALEDYSVEDMVVVAELDESATTAVSEIEAVMAEVTGDLL